MNSFLQPITDWVTSKKGMWITLGIWLLVTQKQQRKYTKKSSTKES